MKRILFALVALFILLIIIVPVMAQTSTPIPLPDAGSLLLRDVLDIIASYGAITGAAATILIGFAKYIPGLNTLSAPLLSVIINGLLVIGYWAAVQFGLITQYQEGLKTIENVGQLLLALIVSILGSSFFHQQAVKGKVPVAGYQRSPD